MKPLICIVLCLCLLLALPGCGEAAATQPTETVITQAATQASYEGEFRVGYSKINITPKLKLDLWGYAQPEGMRVYDEVMDYIYLTCVAISDENNNTVLFYAADLGDMEAAVAGAIQGAVSSQTGIAAENIFINATHTHSAPDCAAIGTILNDAALQTAQEALADQKPATMFYGAAHTQGISFVRHYWDLEGKSVTDNHGNTAATEFNGHTTELDDEMRVLQFQRQDAPDVLLVNWQCHPHLTGGPQKYSLSADIVGAMRMDIEKDGQYLMAYYQGGAGNLNPTSRITEEETNPERNYKVTGQYMAAAARQALQNSTRLETGPIALRTETFTCQSNKEDLDKVEAARQVVDYFRAGHSASDTKPFAESLGLYSYYHASNLVNRGSRDPEFDISISVVTIGEMAWAILPGEFFDSTARYIRENSPYRYTFSLAYTNGYYGYFPTREAWEYGCYEADVSPVTPGTAEAVADRLLEMLKQLHG